MLQNVIWHCLAWAQTCHEMQVISMFCMLAVWKNQGNNTAAVPHGILWANRANRANVSLEKHGGRNVTGIFPDSVPLELDDPVAKVTTSFCQHRKLPLVIKPGNGQLPFTVIFPATNLHFCWGFPIGTCDSRWVLEVRLFLAAGFLKTELVSHNSPHSAQMGDTRETAPLLGKMMINWLTSACKELGLIRATQVSCF